MQLKTIEVYEFDELSEIAKNKVICKVVTFLIESYDEKTASENIKRAVTEADQMQTPWFSGEYILDYAEEEVLEICKGSLYSMHGEYISHLIKEE